MKNDYNRLTVLYPLLLSLLFMVQIPHTHAQCTFTPTTTTVSGPGILGFTSSVVPIPYVPNGTLNGAPKWENMMFNTFPYRLVWTGSAWQFQEMVNGVPVAVIAENTTGSATFLPCSPAGWQDPEDLGYFQPGQLTLSGGCGSLLPETVTPMVDISADPSNSISAGTEVTFTTTPTNSGDTPAYQWKVNGNPVGTGPTYMSSTLADGDIVTVEMTSSDPCADPATATSDAITMVVANPEPLQVCVSHTGFDCPAVVGTYTQTGTTNGRPKLVIDFGGGDQMVMEYSNGNPATGALSWNINRTMTAGFSPYLYTNPFDSDTPPLTGWEVINEFCYPITVTLGECTIQCPPSVTIAADPCGNITAGTEVTFTATPTNGGTTPTYQWKKNGNSIGDNNLTYTDASLADGDVITVEMTSSETCANPALAVSNAFVVQVSVPCVPFDAIISSTTSLTDDPITANVSSGTISKIEWKKNGTTVHAEPFLFEENGSVVAGGNGLGINLNQLGGNNGIFVDAYGNLYVAEEFNDRITKWAPGATQGTLVALTGGSPSDVFVDADGNVYVAEQYNYRVTKWAPCAGSGVVVAGGNGSGSALNQIQPNSIWVDTNGDIYVADNSNYRVMKWTPNATEGTIVAGGNGIGSELNQIYPTSIWLDTDKNIYIADQFFDRVVKWAPGADTGTLVAGGNGSGSGLNKLSSPTDVFVDAAGNVLVMDRFNHRVVKWTPGATEGILMAGIGVEGSGLNQFNYPKGLTVGPDGSLYVSDSDNYRVLKFNGIVENTYTPTVCGEWTALVTDNNGCTVLSNDLDLVSRWYADTDGDGFIDPNNFTDACPQPSGYLPFSAIYDCDDTNPLINPGADEICGDGIDNDCDGTTQNSTGNFEAPVIDPETVVSCPGTTVTLTATSPTGLIEWYDTPTGGTPVGAGSPFDYSVTASTLYAQENDYQYSSMLYIDMLPALAIVNSDALSGDDGRGLAVTRDYVFYTGDSRTVRYDHNLQNGFQFPIRLDGMFSDLHTGKLYGFQNATGWSTSNFDRFQEYSHEGVPIGAPVMLSQAFSGLPGTPMICSGFGYVLVNTFSTSSTPSGFFRIDLPSGQVSLITPTYYPTGHVPAESDWSWYTVEYDDTDYSIVYCTNLDKKIRRLNLTTGQIDDLVDLALLNLELDNGNAQFVYSPWDERLFFHEENGNIYNGGQSGEWLMAVHAPNTVQCAGGPRSSVTIAAPTRLYVDIDATGNSDGTSWADAYTDLQAAIDNTCGVTEIWVAAGTYKPAAYPTGCTDCSTPRDYAFTLRSGVKVYGGFAGTETDLAQRTTGNETILSGDIDNDDILDGENTYHVVLSINDNDQTLLDGLTVTGGYAPDLPNAAWKTVEGTSVYLYDAGGLVAKNSHTQFTNNKFVNNLGYYGGGAYVDEGSAYFENCRFEDNLSDGGYGVGLYTDDAEVLIDNCHFENNQNEEAEGGGCYIEDGRGTVKNSTFVNNSAASGGGLCIDEDEGALTIEDCTFTENTAEDGVGGAIYLYYAAYNEGPTVVSNCTFTDNRATGTGGAIYSYYGNYSEEGLSIQQCSFSGNEAEDGGAIYSEEDYALTIESCTFTNNTAVEDAGAIYLEDASYIESTSITDCQFTNNEAGSDGGAIAYDGIYDNGLEIERCSFLENSALYGGAVCGSGNDNELLIISNSLFAKNTAQGDEDYPGGGALYIYDVVDARVRNCSFADNTSVTSVGGGVVNDDSGLTMTNCILWSNSGVLGELNNQQLFNLSGDANIAYSLIEGGLPTDVTDGGNNIFVDPLFTDAANGDYTLQGCSPAINAGDNADVSATDLASGARIQDSTVDMGAYENVISPGLITAIAVANASDCDGQNTTCTTDDTFTADVTVTFSSIPAGGTLSLTGPTIVGNVPPVDVANIDGSGSNSISVSGFTDTNDNGTYTPDGTAGGATRYTNGVCELKFDGANWEFKRLGVSPFTIAIQNFGNATTVPCSGWVSFGNGTPTLTGACDGNTGTPSYTFTGVTLSADGNDIDLTASFSEGCSYQNAAVDQSPSCGGAGSSIEVSGFTDTNDNGTYTPDGTAGGATRYTNGVCELKFDGANWEFKRLGGAPFTIAIQNFGNATTVPCSGWVSFGNGTPTLTGACDGGGSSSTATTCSVTDITLANTTTCTDNGTTDGTDDYFTTDVTVTFAYAPAGQTLVLTDEGGAVLATQDVDDELLCTTAWTFEGVQLPANGLDVVLTAAFEDFVGTTGLEDEPCTYTSGVLMTAPQSCSCQPTSAFTTCPSGLPLHVATNTCAATATYTAIANGEPAPLYSYTFSGATTGSGDGTGSGSTFALGVTAVTITATNDCGTATCSFNVTVTDNIAPTLSCINQTARFDGESGLDLNPAALAVANDNCGSPTLSLSTPTLSCNQVGQTVAITVTATDAAGLTASCVSQVTVTGLPCGWSQDPDGIGCEDGNEIGYNAATQVWTATSTNCYYAPPFTADEMAFAQRTLCGNGSIQAQVTSVNGSGWAGIVLRESNAPGGRKVQLMTNLGTLSRREVRYTLNGQAYPQQFPSQNRYWLRLLRVGNQFVGYVSANGTQWSQVFAVTVTMGSCLEAGLVTTNATPTGTLTATFANVQMTNSSNLDSPEAGLKLGQQPSPELAVFPNPTSGELYLDLSSYAGRPVTLEVHDLTGRLLQQTQLDAAPALERLDLSAYQSGLYLLRVRTEGQPDQVQRVVLQQ